MSFTANIPQSGTPIAATPVRDNFTNLNTRLNTLESAGPGGGGNTHNPAPLATNHIVLGANNGNNVTTMATLGASGQVLTSKGLGASPAWETVSGSGGGTVTHTGNLTNNAVVLGTGTTGVTTLAHGTSGQVLTSKGTGLPAWEAASGGGTITHTANLTNNALVLGTGATSVGPLAAGTSGHILTSKGPGVSPAWEAAPTGGALTWPIANPNANTANQPNGSQLSLASTTGPTVLNIDAAGAGGAVPSVQLRQSNGTLSAPTLPAQAQALGRFQFLGWNGTQYAIAAEVETLTAVSGSGWTSGNMASRVNIMTIRDGQTARDLQVTIGPQGGVAFGTAAPQGRGSINVQMVAGSPQIYVGGTLLEDWLISRFGLT